MVAIILTQYRRRNQLIWRRSNQCQPVCGVALNENVYFGVMTTANGVCGE